MKVNRQKIYVVFFLCVLVFFFIACSVKYAAIEAERMESHLAAFSHEFPVEEYSKFRPFIETVLISAYGILPEKPLKRQLQHTTCTAHLFKHSEAAKIFAKDRSDPAFSSIQAELSALHSNRCSNVIIQSMSAGLPTFTIALLMLAPFHADYFENIRLGFKWNPEYRADALLKFMAVLRLSIITPSLIVFSKFLNGFEGKEFDFNLLSLKSFDFSDKSLWSLVDPQQIQTHAVVNLEAPRPVVDFSYNFETTLIAALKEIGSERDMYTLKIDWYPGRYVLSVGQSKKLHGKDGKWYHLRAAFLHLKNQKSLMLYDAKLGIWTLFTANGKVQSVPSQFAIRLLCLYGTELCYSTK